jgi:hypothetical protein
MQITAVCSVRSTFGPVNCLAHICLVIVAIVALACGSTPPAHEPAPVGKPLPGPPAEPAGSALSLDSRCALLATVLTHPPREAGGSALSEFEVSATKGLARADGRMAAAATLRAAAEEVTGR